VLITGASTGIGSDLARLFAADGYRVVLVARSKEALEALASELISKHGIDAPVLATDLSVPNAARTLADELTARGIAVDELVNNAGVGVHGPFASADEDATMAMLQVNMIALAQLTRLLLPPMLARGRGRILNVASTAAFQPGPLMAGYYASKAFVLSFSEALDAEVHSGGVSVTALCPGPTQTSFFERARITPSALFRANMMDSATVARIGYRAMRAGKRVAIAGFRNRLLALSARLAPRRLVTAIAKKLNASK
jgi:hypothetical protein